METIHLKPKDWLGIDKRGLFRVNNNTFYNPKYYNLIPETQTQKEIVNRIKPQPQKTENKGVDYELKQLTNMEYLRKKLNSYDNNTEKLKQELDIDNKILLKRRINKAKNLIWKYHTQLKNDKNFIIESVGDTAYKMVYSGDYVTATKTGNIINDNLGVL